MTLAELLLGLHVIASIIWLGAAFVLTLLALRVERMGDAAAKAALNAQNDWLAPRLFIPAATLTFVFGLLLVIEGSWDLGQLWIVLGVAGWLMTFVTGFFYFKPEGERINELVEAHGIGHPEVERRFDRMEAVGRVELTVLFLIVADMVNQAHRRRRRGPAGRCRDPHRRGRSRAVKRRAAPASSRRLTGVL